MSDHKLEGNADCDDTVCNVCESSTCQNVNICRRIQTLAKSIGVINTVLGEAKRKAFESKAAAEKWEESLRRELRDIDNKLSTLQRFKIDADNTFRTVEKLSQESYKRATWKRRIAFTFFELSKALRQTGEKFNAYRD